VTYLLECFFKKLQTDSIAQMQKETLKHQ